MHRCRNSLPRQRFFVYEENGNIRGFAGMTGSYLAGIFVDQTARSRGERKGNPGISERTLSGIYAACVPEKISVRWISICGKDFRLWKRAWMKKRRKPIIQCSGSECSAPLLLRGRMPRFRRIWFYSEGGRVSTAE